MNPRIYKKQAKRAVELLRSHGQEVSEYMPSSADDCIQYPGGWRRFYQQPPSVRRAWERMSGVPVRWYQTSYECDEWEIETARCNWIDFYYHEKILSADFRGEASTDSEITWPRITLNQARQRLSRRQIATDWRWRGGRAIKVSA